MLAILEDDARRIAEMMAAVRETAPHLQCIVFDDASAMIAWLGAHLAEVALLSLDHDLPMREGNGEQIDCGTGRQVADYLATRPSCCPVIIHSTNDPCAAGMFHTLLDAGWLVRRVYPHDDLTWIGAVWKAEVRTALAPV